MPIPSDQRILRRPVPAEPPTLPSSLHPILRRVYSARRLTSEAELERDLGRLPPPALLPGMARAVPLLQRVLERRGRILVVGDFDADGATSSALAVLGLRALGAGSVDYLVPNRFEYGYGLTPEIVAVALQRQPELILTVDNGISSLDGVAAAHRAGVPVLITDHHLPGAALPEAAAIVNPQLANPSAGPVLNLAGVGVLFFLLIALRSQLRASGWFSRQGIAEPNLAEYLDLVALGTVADVVPLDHVNRILVHQGLQRMRAGRCRPGIAALLRVAGRAAGNLAAADLGFALGPRLNAAGRLADMSQGIECLLSDDPAQALGIAQELDRLNRERRRIEEEMRDDALAWLEGWAPEDGELPFGLCLYQPEWHQGVIGILASRIKDRYHRPVIAFAPGGEGILKGSARSVPGLHIRDALDAVATRHPGLLKKFGGHAMAAGLSLAVSRYDEFRHAFDEEVRRHLAADDLCGIHHSDGPLAAADFSLELAELLRKGGPWGQGFPEPTFDGRFRVVQRRVLKERHLRLLLSPLDGGQPLGAIAFAQAEGCAAAEGDLVESAYRLEVNEYNGRRDLQLNIQFIRTLEGP